MGEMGWVGKIPAAYALARSPVYPSMSARFGLYAPACTWPSALSRSALPMLLAAPTRGASASGAAEETISQSKPVCASPLASVSVHLSPAEGEGLAAGGAGSVRVIVGWCVVTVGLG